MLASLRTYRPIIAYTVAALGLFGIISTSDAAEESQLPELLIPVHDEELREIQERNDYMIKARLYFSKRHRFVRVDHTVLENHNKLQISLFPDKVLTVSRTSIDTGTVIRWQGQIEDPVIPALRSLKRSLPLDQAAALSEEMHTLRMVGVSFDYESSTGRSFAGQSVRNIEGYERPSGNVGLHHFAFFGFSTEFAISYSETYRLISLEVTPDVHLLYELDRSKMYLKGQTSDPKNSLLRQQHEEFVISLGKSPRETWKARHRDEIQ